MAYPHKAHRWRGRRRGQKGGFIPLLPLMGALVPAVVRLLASQMGRGGRRIVARRSRRYINRP